MDITEISKVQEVIVEGFTATDSVQATEKVNSLIEEGWVLLKLYTTCYDEISYPNQQTLHYVLGLPKETTIELLSKIHDFKDC